MGRFHRHADGSGHLHDDGDDHGRADHHHHLLPDGADLTSGTDRGGESVGDHSAYETGTERVIILEHILDENDRVAAQNRRDLGGKGVRTVNLMSSPGAGKTSLLTATIPALADELRIGILEGDIATTIDADTLAGLGAEVALVNTSNGFGGECHLDAVMVRSGLDRLSLDEIDLLIIENVGNLVCPAEFDVGQDRRAMVYAITEGEEKPLKYPVMFRSADVVVVNKMDLLPHLDFDLDLFRSNLQNVNPTATVIELSARTGDGVGQWLDWLRQV
jgi:hydrogenase nickel incorporation protein HypB